MSERLPVTRRSLQRDLALNAATKPLALGVGAGVAAAALLIGTPWLLVVALVAYIGVAVATFFDGDEAARVGRAAYARAGVGRARRRPLPAGLAPELSDLVERARDEERRVLEVLRRSDVPTALVSAEVEALTAEMERVARRAQVVWAYRQHEHPAELRRRLELLRGGGGAADAAGARGRAVAALEDRIRLVETLDGEYERFVAEMEHLIASLGVVHAHLVRMSVADDARLQEDVAGEVRELRERVGTVADAMRDAVAPFDGDCALNRLPPTGGHP